MRLFSDENAASAPKDPRLSPNTTRLGRCPSGSVRTRAEIASNRASPAFGATVRPDGGSVRGAETFDASALRRRIGLGPQRPYRQWRGWRVHQAIPR